MLDSFFGVHPLVIRSGLWARMLPGQQSLYIYLMEESERCCTREIKRADQEITATVGVAARTLCNARKKLQEYGLVVCRRGEGNKYTYTICNPVTKLPYPGPPREPLVCAKRIRGNANDSITDKSPLNGTHSAKSTDAPGHEARERHGVPGIFQ